MQDHHCKRDTVAKGKLCPVILNHPNFYISLLCVDCPVRVEYERMKELNS